MSFLVLQKQQELTGEQASLLNWFTDKMADVACEQQLQAQHSPPRQQVILVRPGICHTHSSHMHQHIATSVSTELTINS